MVRQHSREMVTFRRPERAPSGHDVSWGIPKGCQLLAGGRRRRTTGCRCEAVRIPKGCQHGAVCHPSGMYGHLYAGIRWWRGAYHRLMAGTASRSPCVNQQKLIPRAATDHSRPGFTLLELMLSLGLTIVILLVISMAIDLHLRSFDSRRKQLEESQLARAILKIIADDIRNTVQEYEQDLSGLEQMIASAVQGSAQGGGVLSAGGEDGSGEADERSGDTTAALDSELANEATTAAQDLASSVTLPAKPGIYGNQYQLQMDVSRLPRFDELQSMLAASNTTLGITDIPSDIKTVTYYVLSGNTPVSASGMTATNQDVLTSTDPNVVQRGLVRRQLDRAVSQYALANGLLAATEDSGEVVAAEVASIEFQYFDGIEWRYEWDTEVEGALPVAIQIVMLLEAPSAQNLTADESRIGTSTDLQPSDLHYYRLLVPVATGQATAAEEDTSLEAAGI